MSSRSADYTGRFATVGMLSNKKRIIAVRPWSAEKLQLLQRYLISPNSKGGFLPATQSAGQRYYLDLFAGPGQNEIEGTGQVIDGSPLVALKAGPPAFTHLWWIDASRRNAESLEAHRDELAPGKVTVLCGDANTKVDDALMALPKSYPVFAFLDPYGAHLHWRTVEKLAAHKPKYKIELFILFAYDMGLVRLLPNDPTKLEYAAVLDRVMPDPQGWRNVYAQRTHGHAHRQDFRRAFLNEYVRGLKTLGYAFVLPPRLIRSPDNHPMYFMVFASDHPAGGKIMEWCLANVAASLRQPSLLSYDQRY